MIRPTELGYLMASERSLLEGIGADVADRRDPAASSASRSCSRTQPDVKPRGRHHRYPRPSTGTSATRLAIRGLAEVGFEPRHALLERGRARVLLGDLALLEEVQKSPTDVLLSAPRDARDHIEWTSACGRYNHVDGLERNLGASPAQAGHPLACRAGRAPRPKEDDAP